MDFNFKKTACADAMMNNEFIYISTFSGYSMFQKDPKGKEHYVNADVCDVTLGNLVLDALIHSRFVLPNPDHREGVWVHPDVTYDPDLDDYSQAADRYECWVIKVMKTYGYKTRRAMFKKMKNCSISLSDGVIKIEPSRHQKLEEWGRRISDGIEEVIIPGGSTPEEIGTALRLAFSRCIG